MSSLEQRNKFIGYLKVPIYWSFDSWFIICHDEVDLPELSCDCKYVHGFQAFTRLEAVRIGNDGHIILIKNWMVGVQLQKA